MALPEGHPHRDDAEIGRCVRLLMEHDGAVELLRLDSGSGGPSGVGCNSGQACCEGATNLKALQNACTIVLGVHWMDRNR